ncbi:hypothetical protein GLV81_08245 [Phnomibacter ginsenosidimutans]|uniref:G8 domain-containing protein n=2 Tax=Phnomibacter ginsenosidimutans TaxID=2676868 RepID=A0A6I6GCU2_9BACT|nr:hypothetical protein GLV81_08245 [Phnomibacter ginsenosidimutans]
MKLLSQRLIMKQLLTVGVALLSLSAQAQLVVQNGATFFIDAGATVTVQGDVTASANISGSGKLLMKGTSLQSLNLNGFSVPNLEIDNAANVVMAGAGRVDGILTFTTGKLQLGNFNLTMANAGSFAGAGTGRFVETNGTGELRKEMTAAGTVSLPVGLGSDFTPLQFQVTGGSYSSAFVGGRAVSGGHPAKHPRTSDFLNHYWSLNRSGITGATVTTVGTYVDPSDVTGTEADMRAMTYDGSNWALGSSQDNTGNTVTAPMSGNTGDLYAMNRFVLVSPKVFLQGAFNSGTGLMSDALRSTDVTQTPGNASSNNLIPTSDPYRTAPLSTNFTHVNNLVAESINSSVLNHLANPNDHIVDWVFLELRNNSTSGNTVLQTRSALIQRDGDIVDIDGVSPVYFKNVDAGNFSVGIRHRNHIGIYTNPASFTPTLSLASSTLNLTTISSASLMGAANSSYFNDGSRNMLFAGNSSQNTRVSYSGSGNDASYILSSILSSNASGNLNNIYSVGDVNFNRRVTYSGSGNDASYILSTPLASAPSTIRTEVKPN